MSEAFVTLAWDDNYGIGCLVLAKSLRKCGTTKQLIVMVTSVISPAMKKDLEQCFDRVKTVNMVDSSAGNYVHFNQPDHVYLTKINCWLLTNYTKCVFINADCLVLQNIDNLFSWGELSAVPDVQFPGFFNMNIFVYTPSAETFAALKNLGLNNIVVNEQTLLNTYFNRWYTDSSHHLSYDYNAMTHNVYCALPFQISNNKVKGVHFNGLHKPWCYRYDFVQDYLLVKGGYEVDPKMLAHWWILFLDSYYPKLPPIIKKFIFHLDYLEPSGATHTAGDVQTIDVQPGQDDTIGHETAERSMNCTEAFVTLATTDEYGFGCLALAKSLRNCGTTKQLAVMVTFAVSPAMIKQLEECFDLVKKVSVKWPTITMTLTRINCWLLTNYTKCVFMGADTLVLQSIDELFSREELSAAPDVRWPDYFNTGVFVYKPSLQTFETLKNLAITKENVNGRLLNLHFSDWAKTDISKHLPFTYNVVYNSKHCDLTAYRSFRNDIKVIHFIGPIKPWYSYYDYQLDNLMLDEVDENNREFLQNWWNVFIDSYLPKSSPAVRRAIFREIDQTMFPGARGYIDLRPFRLAGI